MRQVTWKTQAFTLLWHAAAYCLPFAVNVMLNLSLEVLSHSKHSFWSQRFRIIAFDITSLLQFIWGLFFFCGCRRLLFLPLLLLLLYYYVLETCSSPCISGVCAAKDICVCDRGFEGLNCDHTAITGEQQNCQVLQRNQKTKHVWLEMARL